MRSKQSQWKNGMRVMCAIGFLLGGASVGAQQAVTPVEGPSTLHRLGLTIEQSSIGSASWAEGIPPPPDAATASSTAPHVLTGGGIYRVSCRPCHTADGSGAMPEVHSLVYPVQSASVTWLSENARKMGRPVDTALIRKQAASAEAALRSRLQSGGHNMPSFAHLSNDEINVLRPYLDQLAGIPGAERRQRQIAERPVRVGELIVKGTCHICHDATKIIEAPATALNGVIPSLASISKQQTAAQIARKLRAGGRVPLHAGGQPARQGRMPVLGYLTDAELAAVYEYLIAYPPK